MLKFNSILFILIITFQVSAQDSRVFEKAFEWSVESFVSNLVTEEDSDRFGFKDGGFSIENPYLPLHSYRFPVSGPGQLKVQVLEMKFLDERFLKNGTDLTFFKNKIENQVAENITFSRQISQNRRSYNAKVFFNPAIISDGQVRFIESIKIKVTHIPSPNIVSKTPPTNTSVLSEGKIFKLKISDTGMHKITGSYIQDKMSMNLSEIDPNKIQFFNNPGGKVPENNSEDRTDDLREIPIELLGVSGNTMSADDAIIFFAEGSERWIWDSDNEKFDYDDNPFEVDNYVFVRFNVEDGKRITSQGNNVPDIPTVDSYMATKRYELNNINLLEDNFGTLGTGQEWYGEYFDLDANQNFTAKLPIDQVKVNQDARVKMRFVGRSSSTSTVKLNIGAENFIQSIPSTSLTSYSLDYARIRLLDETFNLSQNMPAINIDYSNNGGAVGWLDYIEVHYQRNLQFGNGQLEFNNLNGSSNNEYNLQISNTNGNCSVWNISNPENCFEQNLLNTGSTTSFTSSQSSFNKFVIFDSSSSLIEPEFVKEVENQNLHNISNVEMIIVTSPSLFDQAQRLAEHRSNHSGTEIIIVNIEQIYNEFSGGKQEPTAIRDFFRMIYDRDPGFKFGLLFGNGSFDYKGILHDNEEFNVIPVYETRRSVNAISNFPSDDYYGLLSNQDGASLIGEVDLAIGRIPVANSEQARMVVDKIIKYDTDPEVRGPWNLKSIFAADDEDTNLHINPSDRIAESFIVENSDINTTKIFFDSYPQVSTPGGERYPSVTEDINSNIFNGALTFCYLGHGGPTGWAQERVLMLTDIDNWTNTRSYPLFITATCSLASYDDPSVFSAGEKILVSDNGGIALFTTSRAVYASDNTRLTESVFEFILAEENDEAMQIGEILRNSKNATAADTLDPNARKFMLLGDPSMRLLYPKHDVVTTSINNVDVTQNAFTDTITALSEMSIAGYVADEGEKLTAYNGEISVTVYDKRTLRKTLVQDPGSRDKEFMVQRNIIFKGKAKVTNGDFALNFVVPKDILFTVGQGKISYYATDFKADARGNFTDFLVGGSSTNPIKDENPPVVEVFMNDENFVFGGLTDPNPFLYAKISDDIGINLSGASVGHDLTGKLDDKSQNTYFLNDFYESDLNNFSQGVVKYPLSKLENGKHKISVRAWDVANNVGEGFTEFIVSDDPTQGLAHVLNYPNPFTDNTCFMFEHNMGADIMDVQIDIYTVSGKLVKTIAHNTVSDGYRISDIKWDGNDDFGSPLGKGVYLYKVKVKAQQQNLRKESNFEKLVILK
ncbi:type IX secretion system sortase PorU [Saprospiraceae bacterium]|nr:type IX secretion system sortase PorU [Saprospiraceae bacterium]